MGTPHNSAEPGEIARTVLMPGDPFRAEFIAKNWLTDVRLVNQIRNIYAFTGRYHDTEVTVMASGMGMPSIGIYSCLLYTSLWLCPLDADKRRLPRRGPEKTPVQLKKRWK